MRAGRYTDITLQEFTQCYINIYVWLGLSGRSFHQQCLRSEAEYSPSTELYVMFTLTDLVVESELEQNPDTFSSFAVRVLTESHLNEKIWCACVDATTEKLQQSFTKHV